MNFSIYSLATRENFGYCFLDAEEYFAQSLQALGHDVSYSLKQSQKTDYYLVFGWHLSNAWQKLSRDKVIVIQLENLITGNLANGFSPMIFEGVRVWEYSYFNVCRYEKEVRSLNVFHYGYLPTMQEYDHASSEKNHDLYFVGSRTGRRNRIFESLEMNRVTMKIDFGVFGVDVDKGMRQCRAVISPHAYHGNGVWGNGSIPASLRIAYALNQNCPVFAERSGDEMTDRYWSQYVTLFSQKDVAVTVVSSFDFRYQEMLDKTAAWRSSRSMKKEVKRLVEALS